MPAHHLSKIKYQTEFAIGSTIASVRAIVKETSATNIKTVIAIAHRLSTIRNSDMILVMDTGKIVERGSHVDLVGQNGVYAGLFEILEDDTASENILA